eukprot:TRINITY_DN15115_c0_g1_i2.p1 TRINITY_DN15115_c0_g1~~TRINITY_DN15115_c0_g1_i2.p1  ORF type:complete len:629 (-),score=144.61 TRINITY_DN15115_c0_g1_i2:137-1807(-)
MTEAPRPEPSITAKRLDEPCGSATAAPSGAALQSAVVMPAAGAASKTATSATAGARATRDLCEVAPTGSSTAAVDHGIERAEPTPTSEAVLGSSTSPAPESKSVAATPSELARLAKPAASPPVQTPTDPSMTEAHRPEPSITANRLDEPGGSADVMPGVGASSETATAATAGPRARRNLCEVAPAGVSNAAVDHGIERAEPTPTSEAVLGSSPSPASESKSVAATPLGLSRLAEPAASPPVQTPTDPSMTEVVTKAPTYMPLLPSTVEAEKAVAAQLEAEVDAAAIAREALLEAEMVSRWLPDADLQPTAKTLHTGERSPVLSCTPELKQIPEGVAAVAAPLSLPHPALSASGAAAEMRGGLVAPRQQVESLQTRMELVADTSDWNDIEIAASQLWGSKDLHAASKTTMTEEAAAYSGVCDDIERVNVRETAPFGKTHNVPSLCGGSLIDALSETDGTAAELEALQHVVDAFVSSLSSVPGLRSLASATDWIEPASVIAADRDIPSAPVEDAAGGLEDDLATEVRLFRAWLDGAFKTAANAVDTHMHSLDEDGSGA